MNKRSFKLFSIACAVGIMAIAGCTKLKEQVIDEVLGSNSASPLNALASAYGQMDNGTFVNHAQAFALQEYSTNEAILPTRGSDWGDGGIYRAIHEFTWDGTNSMITNTWNSLNTGITLSLTAINSVNNSTASNKAQLLAEAKGMLDLYTYHALDLFGQAPYRDPASNNAPLQVRKAASAIDSLISDVVSLIPNLSDIGQNSTGNGRFTKEAAYALLADMYLNRAVFKDRYNATSAFNFSEAAVDGNGTDMDKVITYTSQLIGSGQFKLESNFFHNFDIQNSNGTELIFVITQFVNTQTSSSNNFAYMPMERNQKPSPADRGTNASCTTPEFYHTWDNNQTDPRFQRHYQYADGTWFMNDGTDVSVPATSLVAGSTLPWFHFNRGMQVGQQYGPSLSGTDYQRTPDGRIKVNKLYCEKAPTTLMVFTPELKFDDPTQGVFTQVEINQGVRPFKFEFDPQGLNSRSNSAIPMYRLGGMYCMRAEAYLRKGQTAQALADVNALRTSRTREALYGNAPGVALTSIDMPTLYNETGFEMYWEMYRRKASIRFGTFEAAGTTKPVSQPFRRIYPIPQSTLDATKIFAQNSGY
jgi:hypothetical protein